MTFLTQAIRQPKHIGAIAPSSDTLAKLITDRADLARANVVVELGPGTGAFTKEIIKKINPTATYFTIELNTHFAKDLRLKYPTVDTIHGSAEHLQKYLTERGHKTCDRVISGLPWVYVDDNLQKRLLSTISTSLAPGGLFLTFSYYPFNHLPRGRSFRKKLLAYFTDVERTDIVLNLPLAFVYICKK